MIWTTCYVDNRTVILLAILSAEILASIASDSDALRAAAVSLVVGPTLLLLFFSWCMAPSLNLKKYVVKPLVMATSMVAVGVYGMAIAVLRHNSMYYLAADVYHWFIELLLMTAITIWAVARSQPIGIAIALAAHGIILGGMGLFTFVAGTAGFPVHGGQIVSNLHIWRLELSRGFPMLPLLFTTAALFIRKRDPWPKQVRVLLWIAFAIYLPGLVVTLKRSMWLCYLGGVVLLFLSKRKIMWGAIIGLVSIPIIATFVVLFRDAIMSALVGMADLLTYNPSYSVEDTLGERVKQILTMLPYLAKNMYGYGMGAQFYGYWPGENTFGVVHYIHNLYIYYLLQIGLPGTGMMFFLLVWLLWTLLSHMGRDQEWEWILRASFASVTAMAVNGMVLVSIHTCFAGLVVGLGLMAYIRVRDPVPARRVWPTPAPLKELRMAKGAA